ncbi:fibrinogen alpha chain [Antennarius striatus]|uniref:fibrinogen alpha chain n=1 Tax=Antennarius striatus TaxID=241820 RepID=UPI0035B3D0F6
MQSCPMKTADVLCSDDDWASKCPSGCRLRGLITQTDIDMEKKLRNVCKMAQINHDAAEKSMTAMTHMYSHNRRILVNRYVSELKFVEYAEGLARNVTSLRERSSKLSQQLIKLSQRVQKQVEELYRTEVDIDMKLRACRGSCHLTLPFSVDHHSYQLLQTDMDQMENTLFQKWRTVTPHEDIPHIRLKPVDVGPAPHAEYKSIPMVKKELLTQFEDIGQNRIVLEETEN